MFLASVLTSLVSVYAPVVVLYIFAVILIDIVVRAFRGGY